MSAGGDADAHTEFPSVVFASGGSDLVHSACLRCGAHRTVAEYEQASEAADLDGEDRRFDDDGHQIRRPMAEPRSIEPGGGNV